MLEVGEDIRVERPNGYNYIGTVVRECGREYVVEDTQGNERVVRPFREGVSVVDVSVERRSRGRSL